MGQPYCISPGAGILTRRKMKFATALLFVLGLLLAMSDGPLFPYINFLGVVVFWGSLGMVAKIKEDSP